MNYKETLFFIGKCLTINHEEHNKIIVKNTLKNENVDWESIVKVSTSHYVFPALYCNLKKANFLNYLPKDLVEYMKHITNLNRERNQQIIEQAKEINQLLLENNITPIFLKGTGNLLEGLYDDIAERMVGDIDFLVSKNQYLETANILLNFGYSRIHDNDYDPLSFKHYPELHKEGSIAAVEIHKNILKEKYSKEFNYSYVSKDILKKGNLSFLSYRNQLPLSIIASQIEDDGYYFKNIPLRNAYDVFLQSKKTLAQNALKNFDKLQKPIHYFLAISYEVFNKPASLKHPKTKGSNLYVRDFYRNINNEKKLKNHYRKTSIKLFIMRRLGVIYKSIFRKEYRNWLIKRTTDKNWQKEKLIQLGLKKPKPNS